jgi:hypothetical protein
MQLDQHLDYIRRLLEHDKELARHLGFKVQPKNHGDKSRLLKFGHYLGPDNDTSTLLESYAVKWYCDPLQFWDHSSATGYNVLADPQEQIYLAYLQSMHDHA